MKHMIKVIKATIAAIFIKMEEIITWLAGQKENDKKLPPIIFGDTKLPGNRMEVGAADALGLDGLTPEELEIIQQNLKLATLKDGLIPVAKKLAAGMPEAVAPYSDWYYAARKALAALPIEEQIAIACAGYDMAARERELTKKWVSKAQEILELDEAQKYITIFEKELDNHCKEKTLRSRKVAITTKPVETEEEVIEDSLPGILWNAAEGTAYLIKNGVCTPEQAMALEKANDELNMNKRVMKGGRLKEKIDRARANGAMTIEEFCNYTIDSSKNDGYGFVITQEELDEIVRIKKIQKEESFRFSSDFEEHEEYYRILNRALFPEKTVKENGEIEIIPGNMEGAILSSAWRCISMTCPKEEEYNPLTTMDEEDKKRFVEEFIRMSRDENGVLRPYYAITEFARLAGKPGDLKDFDFSGLITGDEKAISNFCTDLCNCTGQYKYLTGMVEYYFKHLDDVAVANAQAEYKENIFKTIGFANSQTFYVFRNKFCGYLQSHIAKRLYGEAACRVSDFALFKGGNLGKLAITADVFGVSIKKDAMFQHFKMLENTIKRGAKNYDGTEKGVYIGYLQNPDDHHVETVENDGYIIGRSTSCAFLRAKREAQLPTKEVLEIVYDDFLAEVNATVG